MVLDLVDGMAVTLINFETGAEKLEALQHGLFVGSARFVVTEEGYYIETKVSQVIG